MTAAGLDHKCRVGHVAFENAPQRVQRGLNSCVVEMRLGVYRRISGREQQSIAGSLAASPVTVKRCSRSAGTFAASGGCAAKTTRSTRSAPRVQDLRQMR
jgi:hypothetical protein